MTDDDGTTGAPRASAEPQFCYRHPNVETYVHCVRCDRPICPNCMHAASVGFQCPECVRSGRATVRTPRAVYGGRTSTTPYVTFTLIVINVAVFGIMAANGGVSINFGSGGSQSTYAKYALYPLAIAQNHEYYRLVTSMFLHYGVVHILFNMLALFYVGPTLERILGPVRFIVIYMMSGLGGSVLSYVGGSKVQFAAGASGAIFGLFGAFFIVVRKQGMDPRGIVSLIGINLVLGFVIPNVDVLGHIGGLVTGTLVTAGIVYVPQRRYRPIVQGVVVLVVGVVLVAATAARTHALSHPSPGRVASMAAATSAGSAPSR
jgi:membrane associated rhomboid family serine protease